VTEFDRRKAVEAALAAADAAAVELMKRFRAPPGDVRAWLKAPGAPVTDADIASDRAIAAVLRKAEAPGVIVSEEGESRAALEQGAGTDGLTWLIDPLCGTLAFRDGLAHWGVKIALRDAVSLELAVLSVPTAREVFVGVRGAGVAHNGTRMAPVPPRVPLSQAVVCVEIDNGDQWPVQAARVAPWAPKVGAINAYTSIAYPGVQLILGRLAALVVFRVAPVHVAATALIAQELGLRVTDTRGRPVDWSGNDELPEVVIGWPEQHAALVQAMKDSSTTPL